MSTAIVLSGGANLGAMQVGMLRALAEHGVTPNLIVGTSAGALNAAFIAERGLTTAAVDELAQIWRSLRARDVFPPDPKYLFSAVRGRRPSLFSDFGLRKLIDRHVNLTVLEDAQIPLIVVATDLLTGAEVDLGWGPAADLIVLPSPCPLDISPRDFSRADELIERAYREAVSQLAVDGGLRARPASQLALRPRR